MEELDLTRFNTLTIKVHSLNLTVSATLQINVAVFFQGEDSTRLRSSYCCIWPVLQEVLCLVAMGQLLLSSKEVVIRAFVHSFDRY